MLWTTRLNQLGDTTQCKPWANTRVGTNLEGQLPEHFGGHYSEKPYCGPPLVTIRGHKLGELPGKHNPGDPPL
jgi:hypothetical protein